MRRSLFTILFVASISGWISWGERAAGTTGGRAGWVRTVDGWESRRVLNVQPPSALPSFHPGLVAAFQLGASLFFLLAFPGRALPAKIQPAAPAGLRRRATSRVAVAG